MNLAAVLSGEGGLAGIQWAVKGQASRRMLHRQLDQMLQPGCRSGPLRLTRVKYKPRRRLSAFYTCSILDPESGQTRTVPVAVTWRDPADAPDTGGDLSEISQMQEEARQRGLLSPFQQLQHIEPQLGMQLQVWPLDTEFPQLVRLGDPAYSQTLFQSAGIDIPSAAAKANCIKISPVRYRPGERHVLRYQIGMPSEQTSPARRLYVKVYRDSEDAARTARIANRAVDWLDANLQGFRGIKPEGISLEDAAIIYPHADGQPLSQQLRRSPAWLGRQLRLVGAVLATLHRGPETLSAELEADTIEQEIKVIKRASEHIRILLPEVGKSILDIVDRAQDCYNHLPQEQPTFTHSDFKADHLLISPQGMSLIDFDTCALADPALDVGKFLADLEWWHFLTGAKHIEQAQQEFISGYANLQENGRLARARLYQTLILVKITIRRARLYWKDWETITATMIQRADANLQKVMENRV